MQRTWKKDTKKHILLNADGLTPNFNSMSVIVEWFTMKGNYNCWHGGKDSSGEMKKAVVTKISEKIQAVGITVHRPAKDHVYQIGDIKGKYWEACDWLENTGQGVESDESIWPAVTKICKHYYDLQAVMDNRLTARLLLTNLDTSDHVSSDDNDNLTSSCGGPIVHHNSAM